MTDVILDLGPDSSWVKTDSEVFHISGNVLMLSPNVNPNDSKTFRRALAWANGDRLSINHHGDYPGGLSLHGVVTIDGVDRPDGPILPETIPTTIKKTITMHGEIFIEMDTFPEGFPVLVMVSLQQTLSTLQSQIAALENRIAKLGG